MDQTTFAINNRKKLTEKVDKGSIIIINANEVMPSNADGTLPYKLNTDLYWLTVIQQEETTLLLFPDHPDPRLREILFILPVDEHFVKWWGRRLTKEEASNVSGIANVQWNTELSKYLAANACYAKNFYLNTIEHPRSRNKVQTRDLRFIEWCKRRFPLHNYLRIQPILAELRKVKSDYEIEMFRKACAITEQGFRRVLKFVKPGVKEKKIAAEMFYEYVQHDGDWADYEPIVASGANSCILHYQSNENYCKDGDVLLIDAAASYKHFNADLTRTIPVSGRFTDRQKQIYNAVLKVHKALKSFAKAGLHLTEIEAYSDELVIEQLIELGLCTLAEVKEKGKVYFKDKYNYHPFGHLLGLDVHDVGNKYEKLPVNALITVEPGIYIQEEGIGVRIENNVLIKENGTEDLMKTIPIEADEIEDIMNS
ncbi:MAG: aminopeptidase P N-terminal domain-containing protein [Chitinophagaceae bacterium]|nr:aminopeptidase P N-terminal domain-containing protein [Chitinophagaceae bacterium]